MAQVHILLGDHQQLLQARVTRHSLLQLLARVGLHTTPEHVVFNLLQEAIPQAVVVNLQVVGDREVRHQRLVVERELLHLVGNLDGIGQRLRTIGKQLRHLVGTLEVLLTRIAHTLLVVEQLARIQADKVVVRLRIVGLGEVDIVRANQLYAQLTRQLFQPRIGLQLLRVGPLVPPLQRLEELHLQVVVVAKQLLKPPCNPLSLSHILVDNSLRHLASDTRRAADDILVQLREQLRIDTCPTVEMALGEAERHQLNEVVVTPLVLRQEQQVVATLRSLRLLEPILDHIDLAAEDRLDARLGGSVVKLLRTIHITVVRDGKRRHTLRLGLGNQRRDRCSTIQNRILRMYV